MAAYALHRNIATWELPLLVSLFQSVYSLNQQLLKLVERFHAFHITTVWQELICFKVDWGGGGVGLRVVWLRWCGWMASVTKVLSGVFTVKITAWFSTNKNNEYRCLVSADRWTWFYVWLFSCCHLFLFWEVGCEIQCWLPWQLAGYSIGGGRGGEF